LLDICDSNVSSCSRIALYLIARSARGDVRWVAAVFVGSGGTESVVPPTPPADRRREHRESAAAAVARTRSRAAVLRKSELTRFSSASDDKDRRLPGAIRCER